MDMRPLIVAIAVVMLALGGITGLLRRLRQRRMSGDGRTADPLSESWSSPLWEPFKIAIAAMYSLCLQRCYETVIADLHSNPWKIDSFRSWPTVNNIHLVLLYQTIGYITWLSVNFLHNMGLYLLIPPEPMYRRMLGHIQMTLSQSLFYIFGATIGHPSHVQLVLILGLLLLDLFFPLILTDVLPKRVRQIWFFRGWIQFAAIFWLGWQFSQHELKNPAFSLVFMCLMLAQLAIFTPNDIRRLRHLLLRNNSSSSALPHRPNG